MTETTSDNPLAPNDIRLSPGYDGSEIFIGTIEKDSPELVADSGEPIALRRVPFQTESPLVWLAEKILKKDEERKSRILRLLQRGGVPLRESLLASLETVMTHNCYVQVGSNNKMLRIHPSEVEMCIELRGLSDWDNDTLDIVATVCFKESHV